ncbi:hypothetical protein SGPA1_41097 [Streptomyces misionensis JCM 4497]
MHGRVDPRPRSTVPNALSTGREHCDLPDRSEHRLVHVRPGPRRLHQRRGLRTRHDALSRLPGRPGHPLPPRVHHGSGLRPGAHQPADRQMAQHPPRPAELQHRRGAGVTRRRPGRRPARRRLPAVLRGQDAYVPGQSGGVRRLLRVRAHEGAGQHHRAAGLHRLSELR